MTYKSSRDTNLGMYKGKYNLPGHDYLPSFEIKWRSQQLRDRHRRGKIYQLFLCVYVITSAITYLYGDWTDVATVGMAVAVSIFVALVTACVRVGPPSAELAAYEIRNNHSISGFLNLRSIGILSCKLLGCGRLSQAL